MTILVPDTGMDELSAEKKSVYEILQRQQKFGVLQKLLRETREDLAKVDKRLINNQCALYTVNEITRENGLRAIFQRASTEEYSETPEHHQESLRAAVLTFRGLLSSRESYLAHLLHAAKMSLFWPDGMENTIRQGGSGDCYFLAPLDALKGNPHGPRKITDNILFDEESHGWIVQFRGDHAQRKMPITQSDLQEMQRAGRAIREGALGDQILERAYARLSNKRKHNRFDGRRDNDTVRLGERMSFEGGWPDAVFADLLGNCSLLPPLQLDAADVLRHGIFNANLQKTVLACSSFSPFTLDQRKDLSMPFGHRRKVEKWIATAEDKSYFDEYVEYDITDFFGRKKRIVGCHAYAIKEVDSHRGCLTLSNPHNTATTERITISFTEFADKFQKVYQASLA